MPPKKDTAADGAPKQLVAGFEEREVKMLAAAFISSTGPDKVSPTVLHHCAFLTTTSDQQLTPV